MLRARDRRLLIERQRVDALRDFHLARIRHDAAYARHVRPPTATTITTTTTKTKGRSGK